MIRFGPSGNSESFYADGYEATVDAPKWVSEKGMNAFEYSFGRGIRISQNSASEIAEESKKYDVEISVHAPYFINFASDDEVKAYNSIDYITNSLRILEHFAGQRCVFHAGSQGKLSRETAVKNIDYMVHKLIEKIYRDGMDKFIICPETMGKAAQIGSVDEIINICKIDKILYPCCDFGHINAVTGGTLKSKVNFTDIFDKMIDKLGFEKVQKMHVHFSKIEYGPKGEIRHLTFKDDKYGPQFEDFIEAVVEYKLTPFILSESAGTQAEDAKEMRDYYYKLIGVK